MKRFLYRLKIVINMKTIKSLVGLAFVLFASFFVVSCNDDVEETLELQWASVLDNKTK